MLSLCSKQGLEFIVRSYGIRFHKAKINLGGYPSPNLSSLLPPWISGQIYFNMQQHLLLGPPEATRRQSQKPEFEKFNFRRVWQAVIKI